MPTLNSAWERKATAVRVAARESGEERVKSLALHSYGVFLWIFASNLERYLCPSLAAAHSALA